MVDKRIIDYIKSQLLRKVSINQIKQNLLAQGWSYSDIDPAIDLAMQNNSGMKKHVSISTIIGFIIIILASGVLIFFLVGGGDLLKKSIDSTPDTSGNLPSQTESSLVLDCGSDFNCFISKAENCEKVKMQNIGTIELFGMLITTAGYTELKGMESGKCIYYTKTINQTIDFSEEMIQESLAQEITLEEIELQKQESNEAAKINWELDGTCKFNTSDLIFLLNKWKGGDSSTEDFDVAECEGSLFGTSPITTENSNPECKVRTDVIGFKALEGVSSSVSVSDFQGSPNEVYWEVGNLTIASVNQSSGIKVMVEAKTVGITNLTITDNSIPNCTISIPLEVTSVYS